MLLRNIKLRNYPGYSKIDLSFNDSNILLICGNNYVNDLSDISDLFIFFLMLAHPDSNKYMSVNLSEEITTVSIEFNYEDEEYYYYLQLSKFQVYSEELYKDNNVVYQSETSMKKTVMLPKPIKDFLQSLVVIDLTKETWLKDLLDESINKINDDKDCYEIVSEVLGNFKLIDNLSSIRCTGDDIYINGKSVMECNYTIKVVVALLPLFLNCLSTRSVIFLHGFDLDIDMKTKINLLQFFKNKEINLVDSQLIFTDTTSYQEYNLILNSDNKCSFKEDYNKNYILTNLKEEV
jgi:hypothetical protein